MTTARRLKKNTHWRGLMAERAAAWFLRLKGWHILERRWLCKQGEVDLIARKGALLIFVEVKFRADFDAALAALTSAQWQRIERAADIYMSRLGREKGFSWRFDAVCVVPWRMPKHIQGAWG